MLPARRGSRRRARPVRAAAAGTRPALSEKRDRVADAGHGVALRADLDHRVQADLLGERDPGVDGVDRPARHAGGDDVAEPLVLGPGRQPLDQQRPERVPVGGAVLVVGEPRVVDQLGQVRAPRRACANWPSLPAVMIRSPSAQGSGSYGNRLGWLLPIRYGTVPPATYALEWLTRPDRAEESRLTSTCWPRPVSCRWCSAASTPMVACSPAITSNTEIPARYAGPSGSPVRLISPEMACTIRS